MLNCLLYKCNHLMPKQSYNSHLASTLVLVHSINIAFICKDIVYGFVQTSDMLSDDMTKR
jgi:hypothetical protein